MREILALAAVAVVFGGIVIGGLQLFGDDEPVAATTLPVPKQAVPTPSSVARTTRTSTRPPQTHKVGSAATASRRTWARRVNAACVRSIATTRALTARVREMRSIDDMIEVGRLELANERRTVNDIAALERLHPERRVAHQLTLVGTRYVRETERVLDRLERRQLLDALEAGANADTLRAQWGALAGRLGASRCGERNDDVLVGLALDRIGG